MGILIPKSAVDILFDQSLENETILKRMAEIRWQNGLTTQSCFTCYKSKNELRAKAVIEWTNTEYFLFRALEYHIQGI